MKEWFVELPMQIRIPFQIPCFQDSLYYQGDLKVKEEYDLFCHLTPNP